ncbi:hypothetical protein TIFTF001_042174 [Ficus carica]|uniref:Uncharacterized protein n=1 Tax=Ficus carica TaxID=3494 RepID=A0AA87ZMU6_FICCA|nr:hypothetical protein TIFTF001_042174 [Ficus carica]
MIDFFLSPLPPFHTPTPTPADPTATLPPSFSPPSLPPRDLGFAPSAGVAIWVQIPSLLPRAI